MKPKDYIIIVLALAVLCLGFYLKKQYLKLQLNEINIKNAVIEERKRVLQEQKKKLLEDLKSIKQPKANNISDQEILKYWENRLNKI